MVLKKFCSMYCSTGFIQWRTVKVHKLSMKSYSSEILSNSLSRKTTIVQISRKQLWSFSMSWKYYSVQSRISSKRESKYRATCFSGKILNFSIFCYFRNASHYRSFICRFCQVFCSYDNVLVDGYKANKFTVTFISEGL